jgi:hypothetical protein
MFTITLLGVFALAALFVAVMGAQVYAHSAEKMQANFDTRTSLVYIAEKVRQCPGENFDVKQVDGLDALVLTERHKGQDYESWIYVYDEKMYELFIKSGDAVSPGDGQAIMDLKSMQIDTDGRLLSITVENPAGDSDSLTLSRRT